ncbi:DUF4394 domain-containing protein [Methylobacillus gramineus]|uniref:DUF4394 domain-containing protein n=1 Tax=Methylobacillus gramineus TaxID=755169 RepID=UPI001CFF7836|nr:DUF4394 domain-containing protein [Methylobacillus gramineus]MCB5184022.1 DUF4394 domain-containing protein [Methylobacillus gramineus]
MNNAKSIFTASALTLSLGFIALPAHAVSLVALNSNNQIGIFDSASALIDTSAFNTISGAAAGESFIGIDLRPSDNQIYGITATNKIFTIDAVTGSSTFVANLSSNIVSTSKGYGIDFNPVADRTPNASLRLVSSTGDNYAINVTTGAVTTATSISAGFSAVAYTNSDPSVSDAPASTGLYYLNSADNTLSFAATGFNNPTLTNIGSLGVDALSANGFELLNSGSAYAAINYDDGLLKTGLFSIDLNTGLATESARFIGTINGLTLAAVAAVPEPGTYAMILAGLGLIGFQARRKRKA